MAREDHQKGGDTTDRNLTDRGQEVLSETGSRDSRSWNADRGTDKERGPESNGAMERMQVPVDAAGNVDTAGGRAYSLVRGEQMAYPGGILKTRQRAELREWMESLGLQLRWLCGPSSAFNLSVARTSKTISSLLVAVETGLDELEDADRGDGANGT